MINIKEKVNDVGMQKKGSKKAAAVVVYQMKRQPGVWLKSHGFLWASVHLLAGQQVNQITSMTTSLTSPLHTTSGFFVWLKIFSDYFFPSQ